MRFSEHFRQNCPLKTLEIAFQSFSDFKIFVGEKTPDQPSGYLIDASVIRWCRIEKYPHSAYLKSWTV